MPLNNGSTTEGIVATPGQAAESLKNNSAFPTPDEAKLSGYNPNLTTSVITHKLVNNPEWRSYKEDPNRFANNNHPVYVQLERMQGSADIRRAQIAEEIGDYLTGFDKEIQLYNNREGTSWFDRVRLGYNYSRYGMQVAEANEEIARLKHEGASEADIQQAEDRLQQAMFNLRNNGEEFTSYGATASSIAVGIARTLPEMIATSVATAAASAVTGGGAAAAGAARLAGAAKTLLQTGKQVERGVKLAKTIGRVRGVQKAAGAIKGIQIAGQVGQAGIVWNDTYKVEMGSLLEDLRAQYPDLPEDRLYDLASSSAAVIASIEAGAVGLGVGAVGRLSKGFRTTAIKAAEKAGVSKDILATAEFAKSLQKEMQKKTASGIIKNIGGELVLDSTSEGATEAVQDMIHNAALDVAGGATSDVITGTLNELVNMVVDPASERSMGYWETFANVAATTPLFSGLGTGITHAPHIAQLFKPMNDVNKIIANEQLAGAINKLYKEAGKGDEGKREAIKGIISDLAAHGDMPDRIYFDKQSLKEAVDADPELRQIFEKLGKTQEIYSEEAGVEPISISMDEAAAIFGDDKLYSKVQSMTSFQPNVQSLAEFNRYLESINVENNKEIQRAMQNEGSVYNYVLKRLGEQENMSDEVKKAGAALMQLISNRAVAMGLTDSSPEEWFNAFVEIRTNQEQPTVGDVQTAENALEVENSVMDEPEVVGAKHLKPVSDVEEGKMQEQITTNIKKRMTANRQLALEARKEGGKYKYAWTAVSARRESGIRTIKELFRGKLNKQFALDSGIADMLSVRDGKDKAYMRTTKGGIADWNGVVMFLQDNGYLPAAKKYETAEEVSAIEEQVKALFDSNSEMTPFYFASERQEEAAKWYKENVGREQKVAETEAAIEGAKRVGWSEEQIKSYGYDAITAMESKGITPADVAEKKWDADTVQKVGELLAVVGYSKDDVMGMTNKEIQTQLDKYYEGLAEMPDLFQTVEQEYTGETINIDGQERSVYNSNGERIAQSEPALRNFYKWFGDSKVVDEQGKPLVVYHGTNAEFDTFDKTKLKSKSGENAFGDGFYFTDNLDVAERYAYGITKAGRGIGKNNVMSVYLKIENPAYSAKTFTENNDGIIEQHTGKLAGRGTTFVVAETPKFAPTEQEKQTFLSDLESKQTIRLGKLPSVYTNLDWKSADVKNNKAVIVKDTELKHDVPMDVVKQLPELYSDPLLVFESATQPDRLVAVIDAKDNSGRQIIVALSPNKGGKDGYHFIPSFYGRTNFDNFVEENVKAGRLKYIKDNQVSDSLQLRTQALGSITNIKQKSDIVNPQIKSVDNRGTFDARTGNIYMQKTQQQTGEVVAGWFAKESNKYVIALTKAANPTTFSHEAFHMYSRMLQDAYNGRVLTPFWQTQVEKLFKSVGYIPPSDGFAILTRADEEKLAEQFTSYIKNNEVPNRDLTTIFAYMRAAFKDTYKTLRMKEMKLDSSVKKVFDSIFKTQDIIEREEMALGLAPVAKPAGLADSTVYDMYKAEIMKSVSRATYKAIKLQKAFEKAKGEKWYATTKQTFYNDVLASLTQSLKYVALTIAKENNITSAEELVAAYNNVAQDPITEEQAAEFLNSPEQNVIKEAEEIAETKADAALREKMKMSSDNIDAKAVRNRSMARAMVLEAFMRTGRPASEFEQAWSDLVKKVNNQISKMSVAHLLNNKYWKSVEESAVLHYQIGMFNKDWNMVSEARYAQAQAILVMERANEIKNRIERFVDEFPTKMSGEQKKMKNGRYKYSAETYDLLQSLLIDYGFSIPYKRRGAEPLNVKLDTWLKDKEDTTFCPISNLRTYVPEMVKKHSGGINQMNVSEFENMDYVVRAVEKVGAHEYRLVGEELERTQDEMVASTIERLNKLGYKPADRLDKGFMGTIKKALGNLSSIVNPEPVLKALFPTEVFNKVFAPFWDAASAMEVKLNEWNGEWNRLRDMVDLSGKATTYSNGISMRKYQVVDLLLSMGHEHAYENYRNHFGLTEEQAEQIVAEELKNQPALVDFANGTWALLGETTEKMNESYVKRTNKIFVPKEPRAFDLGGFHFTGGYVPENHNMPVLGTAETLRWESLEMGEISNEKLQEADADGENLKSIVDNIGSRLSLFARQSYCAEHFNNIVRFLKDDRVTNAIGDRADLFLKQWLRDFHGNTTNSNSVARTLIKMTSISALGFRFAQGLIQASGLAIGYAQMDRSARKYLPGCLLTNLLKGDILLGVGAKNARTRSDYMAARYADPSASIIGISAKELAKSKFWANTYNKYGMGLIVWMDAIVSNAVWDASYKDSIARGLSVEDAKHKADQDVRLSQTDSMAISRNHALQTDWSRVLTPFSSYMMGMQSVVRGKLLERDKMGAVVFALGFCVFSTFIEAALKEGEAELYKAIAGGEDDDEDYLEKVMKRWYNDSIKTVGGAIMPYIGAGGAATTYLSAGVEHAIRGSDLSKKEYWTEEYPFGNVAAFSWASNIFNTIRYTPPAIAGDDEAAVKALYNFIGVWSSAGKKIVKEMYE